MRDLQDCLRLEKKKQRSFYLWVMDCNFNATAMALNVLYICWTYPQLQHCGLIDTTKCEYTGQTWKTRSIQLLAQSILYYAQPFIGQILFVFIFIQPFNKEMLKCFQSACQSNHTRGDGCLPLGKSRQNFPRDPLNKRKLFNGTL